MYKVVVVDDEPLILRSIKKSIENAHNGFKVVGEALNGEDAISIIKTISPDVVFTDIKMPVIDGLALIEELFKSKIQSKVVILSGYQEFDYAKKALKFGVEEYLLKPISRVELKNLLDKIHDDLDSLKDKKQYLFLESLINDDMGFSPPSPAIHRYFDEYDFFGAILICSGSYCTFNCNGFIPTKDFWLKTNLNFILDNVLQNICRYWILEPGHGNVKLVILAGDSALWDSYKGLCRDLYEKLSKSHLPITIVTDKPNNSIDDIPHIVRRYKIILIKNIIFGNSSLIFTESLSDSNESMKRIVNSNLEKRLSLFVEKTQPECFKSEFKKLLDFCSERYVSQLKLISMLKHIVNLFQISDNCLPDNHIMKIELEIDELISNSYTYQSLYDGMAIIIDDLFYILKDQSIEKSDQRILSDKVEHYIRQNYSKQISLQSMAKDFNVVLPYLSRVFKKHKSLSPMEYIIKLRIEEAKELLQINPSLTIREIAQSVGYSDPYYMSRLFKSVTGKNPSEYRLLFETNKKD